MATDISHDYDVPAEMTAIAYAQPGAADVLRAQTVPVQDLRAGDVLVRVAFAGVNRPDVIQRKGLYPPPADASPLLGLEISGTVVAIGDDVPETWLGRRVCGLAPGGGYAEYCRLPAEHCLPVDDAMPLSEAAAIPETLFTVWHNVFQRGHACDGEKLLVHGGTSGIGTMATMLAKAFGLEVLVTCGTDAKCTAARKFGAAHAFNYSDTDFVDDVVAATGGAGVNIVLDMVSGDYVPRNLRCLAEEGRHVTIAVLGGMTAELNMALIMQKRLTLTGSTLRARTDMFKTLLCQEIEANAWPLFLDGEICPVMDRVFPLADAASAHERMEGGTHIGKIVLEVAGEAG